MCGSACGETGRCAALVSEVAWAGKGKRQQAPSEMSPTRSLASAAGVVNASGVRLPETAVPYGMVIQRKSSQLRLGLSPKRVFDDPGSLGVEARPKR
jgi:hypothetical protein